MVNQVKIVKQACRKEQAQHLQWSGRGLKVLFHATKIVFLTNSPQVFKLSPKPSVRNEHLNGALFTLNHLFLENFAVRHAVSYGESGRELNLVAAEDKTEYEKDKLL